MPSDAASEPSESYMAPSDGAMESLDVMVTQHHMGSAWLEGVDSGVDPYAASSAIDELWLINDV